jgi:hypothetical protein
MRLFFYTILFLFYTIDSFSSPIIPSKSKSSTIPEREKIDKLIFFYLGTDFSSPSLEKFVDLNLELIKKVGISSNVSVKILIKRDYGELEKPTETFIFENNTLTSIKKEKEKNSASKDPLEDFLYYGLNKYDAEEHYIIFHGHGKAWFGLTTDETDINRLIGKPDIMKLNTLHYILLKMSKNFNIFFDLVLFVNCYMGSIEVAYALRHTTKTMVASMQFMPGPGYPYDMILKALLKKRNCDVKSYHYWVDMCLSETADELVTNYLKFYSGKLLESDYKNFFSEEDNSILKEFISKQSITAIALDITYLVDTTHILHDDTLIKRIKDFSKKIIDKNEGPLDFKTIQNNFDFANTGLKGQVDLYGLFKIFNEEQNLSWETRKLAKDILCIINWPGDTCDNLQGVNPISTQKIKVSKKDYTRVFFFGMNNWGLPKTPIINGPYVLLFDTVENIFNNNKLNRNITLEENWLNKVNAQLGETFLLDFNKKIRAYLIPENTECIFYPFSYSTGKDDQFLYFIVNIEDGTIMDIGIKSPQGRQYFHSRAFRDTKRYNPFNENKYPPSPFISVAFSIGSGTVNRSSFFHGLSIFFDPKIPSEYKQTQSFDSYTQWSKMIETLFQKTN